MNRKKAIKMDLLYKVRNAIKFLTFNEDNPKHRVLEAHAWQGVLIGISSWVITGLFFKYIFPVIGLIGFIVFPAFGAAAFAMFLHIVSER